MSFLSEAGLDLEAVLDRYRRDYEDYLENEADDEMEHQTRECRCGHKKKCRDCANDSGWYMSACEAHCTCGVREHNRAVYARGPELIEEARTAEPFALWMLNHHLEQALLIAAIEALAER